MKARFEPRIFDLRILYATDTPASGGAELISKLITRDKVRRSVITSDRGWELGAGRSYRPLSHRVTLAKLFYLVSRLSNILRQSQSFRRCRWRCGDRHFVVTLLYSNRRAEVGRQVDRLKYLRRCRWRCNDRNCAATLASSNRRAEDGRQSPSADTGFPFDITHMGKLSENAALKEQLAILQMEKEEAILNHSTESDQRPLQYTNKMRDNLFLQNGTRKEIPNQSTYYTPDPVGSAEDSRYPIALNSQRRNIVLSKPMLGHTSNIDILTVLFDCMFWCKIL
ncbi:hypothetical protein J6590_069035 [Homalodisca vitripennis]|nr:hypothetical protein J6590_069035 [Homalodisca vitripennis]